MNIEKRTEVFVEPNGVVIIREAMFDMDADTATKYHRTALSPGQNVLGQPAEVQEICAKTWTPEVLAAWQASRPVPSVPNVVTMRQVRLALLQNGLLSQVNDAVAAIPGVRGDAARIEWEFSISVERRCPLVLTLASAIGLTEAQLDELFTTAAGIDA